MKMAAKVILILGAIYLPILGLWYMTGLSGSNPWPHIAMVIGHLVVLAAAYRSMKEPRFFTMIVAGAALFTIGYQGDKKFWRTHNQELCAQIKQDPYCAENVAGFVCREPSPRGNMALGKDMCPAAE